MFVVADQQARGVGRKRGLAGAGQAKEHGGLVRDGIHTGRAVHGQHVVLDGQQVIHDAENGLFDLAGVAGAGDQNHALLEVNDHGGAGVEALDGGIALVARRGEHAEVRLAGACDFTGKRAGEHLLNKERLAGTLAGDKQTTRMVAVGTGHTASDEHVALVEIVDDAGLDGLVALDRQRAVDGTPGNLVVNIGGVNDKAVIRRAASALPRLDHQRAVGGHTTFVATDGVLDELGCRQVDQQAGLVLGRIFDQRNAKVGQNFCRGNTWHGASFKSATRGRGAHFTHVKPVVPDMQKRFCGNGEAPAQRSKIAGKRPSR